MRKILVILIYIVVSSCASKQKATQPSKEEIDLTEAGFHPELTVIKATVLELAYDSTYHADTTHPCGIYPCLGKIKVDSILQKGSSKAVLITETPIQVRFQFTAGKANKFFKALNHPLPGLSKGDSFYSEILFEPNNLPTVKQYILVK